MDNYTRQRWGVSQWMTRSLDRNELDNLRESLDATPARKSRHMIAAHNPKQAITPVSAEEMHDGVDRESSSSPTDLPLPSREMLVAGQSASDHFEPIARGCVYDPAAP